MRIPITTKIYNARTKHVFKGADRALSLTVGLGMECGTEIKSSTESGLECLPETRSESTIAVRDDVTRCPMSTNDFVGIDSC
ncbi:hypothetical protein HanRHA438_Chr16g0741041 [Helianthus annuus]|nr:hypothetical protein HanRHA438_Chr16g0741041 [Helianthus annuus]